MNASISGSGSMPCSASRSSSVLSSCALCPTPFTRAEKSIVSRTVSSPMCTSPCSTYALVRCGTNSFSL